MVFLKKLDSGSNGIKVPSVPPQIPRAKRSARRKVEEKDMCAFDLLATVAGELLSGKESILLQKPDVKKEFFDQGSCNEAVIKTPPQAERKIIGNVIDGNDPMDVDGQPPALVSSDSSVDVSIPKCVNGDDENSSACTHVKKEFRPQHIGDRRVRKMFSSKFWKVAPKDNAGNGADRTRKLCYTRQKIQRSSFKRRKLLDRRSVSASDLNIYDAVSPKPGGVKIEANSETVAILNAEGASSSTSGDSHVKLNIKSFKVPELFIEIPENATVGSLKRTVMEAVTAILGSGLRVGVLHQGKKVRDDNKTLLQAGISHNDKMDNLGFLLEPSSTPTPTTLPLLCPDDTNATEQLKMIPAVEVTPVTPDAPQNSNVNCIESDHDSVATADSKALVPFSSINNGDALAVVPTRKTKRTELAQRRIRRPFSVSEVEALVQAVEKLGTGRWRDVKIRAFDDAKHRTYVDLKDKWKTLVHTARISPQQRRGEPVPQQLLDRVLAAHAFWSSQQAKPSAAELAN